MTANEMATCARCGRAFIPRFRFQTRQDGDSITHFCSQTCREPGLSGTQEVPCAECGRRFLPSLVAHLSQDATTRQYFCSEVCRPKAVPAAPRAMTPPPAPLPTATPVTTPVKAPPSAPPPAQTSPARMGLPRPQGTGPRAIAVLNQKGGTAKTTTALSVAAGFAKLGFKTLLIDLDPQGNIGVSLGQTSPRTVYHLLIHKVAPARCVLASRPNLDLITADEKLAAAEVELARLDEKTRMNRVSEVMQGLGEYQYVVFDCAPAQSIINQSALFYAGEVLIPVSCDYLALVGVKQVLRTLRRVTEQTGRAVRVAGVLPTFYDVRNKLSLDALNYLRQTFATRALPPVRVNTKLAEAPSNKKTIFEYAPESHGARDYIRVVQWLRTSEGTPATVTQAA